VEREQVKRAKRRLGSRHWVLAAILLGLLAGGVLAWVFRDYLRSPEALYHEAQGARPERAAVLYERLAEKLPQIEEYARLWAAEATMPDLEALRTLQAIVAFRPQSPAAYQAHVALARHYASTEATEAEDAYRAALALHDTVALRLELARYLEEQGDNEGAYAEHLHVLGEQPDAFTGMRRTGQDPLAVAEDLNAATYYSDALETLRWNDDLAAMPLRARALSGLGRYEEAKVAYQIWLEEMPDDVAAQLGLAQVLVQLGHLDEALSLYQAVDTPDSRLAQAGLLEEEDRDTLIVCAGTRGEPSIEDTVCGGMLLDGLRAAGTPEIEEAVSLWNLHKNSLAGMMKEVSAHGRSLAALGFEEDIEFAARVNVCDILPVLEGGSIVRKQ